jgi:hypothetical protein
MYPLVGCCYQREPDDGWVLCTGGGVMVAGRRVVVFLIVLVAFRSILNDLEVCLPIVFDQVVVGVVG